MCHGVAITYAPRMNIEMLVVEEPDPSTTAIIEISGLQPWLTGDGDINSLCGGCGFTLAEGLDQLAQIQQVVLRCPRCSAYNRTRL